MKVLLIAVLALAGLIAVSCEGDDGYHEGQGQESNHMDTVLRNLREASESHTRLKRACSWWFQWKVSGARVDSDDVTTRLDDLFRQVCNEYGR